MIWMVSEGAEAVSFALEGVRYEIDLSRRNQARMAKAFGPYATAAQWTSGRRSRRSQASASKRSAGRRAASPTLWSSLDAEERNSMRAWGSWRKLATKTARRIADFSVQGMD